MSVNQIGDDGNTHPKEPLFGAVEAGGTKFVCAIGSGPENIIDQASFATEGPEETLAKVVEYFGSRAESIGKITRLGIGCFGPVDLASTSPTWGYIISTPKPKWSNVSIAKPLSVALDVEVALETDVNAALMGEACLGAGQGFQDLAYVTVGTGIGGGIMCDGKLLHGSMHPELGHMFIARHPKDGQFSGACRFHGASCAEGLASGPAIKARWGQNAQTLPDTHEAWDMQAYYLAQLCNNILMMASPKRIILGGGVMQQEHLFPLVRKRLRTLLSRYVPMLDCDEAMENLLVPPALGQRAGILGAMLLARH